MFSSIKQYIAPTIKIIAANHEITVFKLSQILNISIIDTLELIGYINQVSNNLIISAQYLGLSRTLNFLNQNQINSHLKANIDLQKYAIEMFESLDSTNSYLLDNIHTNNKIVASEVQTLGRGRNGKTWIDNPFNDILMSILLRFDLNYNHKLMPLIVAVAIFDMFKNKFGIKVGIKWPNDLFDSNNSKIAGILIESKIDQKHIHVVIGVGIDNIWNLERNELLYNVVSYIDKTLKEYNQHGFTNICNTWIQGCVHIGKVVSLVHEDRVIATGINVGINEHGILLLKDNDNCYIDVPNGAFSLRIL